MKRLVAFAVRKTVDGKQVWTRAGMAHVADDRTINVQLDVLPLDGAIQLRDETKARGECWVELSTTRARVMVHGDDGKPEAVYDEPAVYLSQEHRQRVVDQLFNILANVSIRRGADIATDWLVEVES